MTEDQLHRATAILLDTILLPPALWTTFPSGWGKLGKATAGRLRASGLKAGMPDILIFFNGRAIGIELKTDKGRSSKDQNEMHLLLAGAGVRVWICRSTDDVIGVLEQEKFPHRRAKVAA